MMNLKIQCLSLVFSFIYGMFFSFFVKINHKFLFNSKGIIKVLCNFLFMFDVSLGYFFLIKKINNGILHIYFFIMFLLGWYIGFTFIVKFLKK